MTYLAIKNTPGYLPESEPAEFDTAADAWWSHYHERVDEERDWERETGICSGCGEVPEDWDDHDDDTEEALRHRLMEYYKKTAAE